MTDTTVPQGEGSVNVRIDRALRDVAFWRDVLTTHKAIMDERRHAFEVANEDALHTLDTARLRLASVETEARDLALAAYAETGSKQPHPGVGVRILRKLDYARDNAFTWALEHSVALQLDVKAFEAIAKSGVCKEIAQEITEVQITIAADLTKALGIEPVAEAESETQRDIDEQKGDAAYHLARDAADIEAAGGF